MHLWRMEPARSGKADQGAATKSGRPNGLGTTQSDSGALNWARYHVAHVLTGIRGVFPESLTVVSYNYGFCGRRGDEALIPSPRGGRVEAVEKAIRESPYVACSSWGFAAVELSNVCLAKNRDQAGFQWLGWPPCGRTDGTSFGPGC